MTPAKRSATAAGRQNGNIEDQIRAANELLRGLEIIAATKPPNASEHQEVAALRGAIKKVLEEFAGAILEAEQNLASAPTDKREQAFNYLLSFLMSFASRTGVRDRLNIFTTNYDRLIEAGAELAGLHLLDRFLGNLLPIFRSSRLDLDMHYNPPGIRGEPRYLELLRSGGNFSRGRPWMPAENASSWYSLSGSSAICPTSPPGTKAL